MKLIIIAFTLMFFSISILAADKYESANNAMFSGDYQKALEIYTEVIMGGKQDAATYYRRGMAYLYLNQFDKAIADFNFVIEKDKKNADAFNNRGLCHSYMGNVDMAFDDFSVAIKLDPKFAQAYINRGSALVTKGEFDKAIADFDNAVKIDPKNPELYLQRAGLYYYLNDYAKSVQNYDKTIELGLINSKIYFNRGNAHFKNGSPTKAIEDLTRAIKLDSTDTEALMNRAYIHHFLGDSVNAEMDKAKVEEIKYSKYTPVEDLKFATYTNAGKDFFLDLPEGWNLIETDSEDALINFFITPENITIESEAMLIGVTVGIMKNMSSKYDVQSESDILDFWKGSLDYSNESMKEYTVKWQRHQQWNNHATILNLSTVQVDENYLRFNIYEYAIAWGNNLIFVYFQAPEETFSYYRKIFDKSLKTIKIGENFKLD
ncbi:MAG: tetratricopeptide repeat protein [Desulfobulbaceae bacterium]|nr:tetratricopeptide repeat protein [Candidatus Kapabacteria bacterium]MBS4000339.1 tetratricopeptide repeat protein [Desulfobulbaceae bacterium]